MSTLQQSPFFLLRATTRADRRKIVLLVMERSLELDSGAAQEARSDLVRPSVRLTAEVAWPPVVSTKTQMSGPADYYALFCRKLALAG